MCFTESNSVVGDSAGVHTQELLLKTERLKNLITGWGVWDISLKPKVGQRFQSDYPRRILWERLLYYCFLQAGSKVARCLSAEYLCQNDAVKGDFVACLL